MSRVHVPGCPVRHGFWNCYIRSVFANSDMRINMQFVEKLIQERRIEVYPVCTATWSR